MAVQSHVNTQGLTPRVRSILEQFQTLFPDFDINSGYRSPKHNHDVGGSKGSRHQHRDAFDFTPNQSISDERKADAINWLRSQGAGGLGAYSKTGDNFHVDFRANKAAWGSNRSWTSLDTTTPRWFAEIAHAHRAGKAPPTSFNTLPPGSIPNVPAQVALPPQPSVRPGFGYSGRAPGVEMPPQAIPVAAATPTYAPRTAPAGDTASMVYGKLRELGVPHNTAAGALGSLAGESGRRLNTSAINPGDGADGSDSLGLAQWNSSRAVALKKVAAEMGLPWTDARVQVEHLGRELQGTHRHVLRALTSGEDSVNRGADVWTKRFEVAAPRTAHQDRRIAHGHEFAQSFANWRPGDQPTQVAQAPLPPQPSVRPAFGYATPADPVTTGARSAARSPAGDPIRQIPIDNRPFAAPTTSQIPMADGTLVDFTPSAGPYSSAPLNTPTTPAPAAPAPTPRPPGLSQAGMMPLSFGTATPTPPPAPTPAAPVAPQATPAPFQAPQAPAAAEQDSAPLIVRGIRPRSAPQVPTIEADKSPFKTPMIYADPTPTKVPVSYAPQQPPQPQGSVPSIWGARYHGPESGIINHLGKPAGTPYPAAVVDQMAGVKYDTGPGAGFFDFLRGLGGS